MQPKTYDFQAFCQGHLIRTNQFDLLAAFIRCFEAPVWDAPNRPMRAIVLPGYPCFWYAYTETDDVHPSSTPPEAPAGAIAEIRTNSKVNNETEHHPHKNDSTE